MRIDREGRDVTDLPGLWSADGITIKATNYSHPNIDAGQHTNGPAMIWICRDDGVWIRTGETHMHKVLQRLRDDPNAWKETKTVEETDRMMKWFAYEHLPEKLQAVSKPFGELASTICLNIDPGPERTVSLRKLLEAKDAAVRAVVQPGG